MTTDLREINVYLHSKRLEIRPTLGDLYDTYELVPGEPLFAEVLRCTEMGIGYRQNENVSLEGSPILETRIHEIFPKLKSIQMLDCQVKPSDLLEFFEGSPIKVKAYLRIDNLPPIVEPEHYNITDFSLAHAGPTMIFIRANRFRSIYLWEYLKGSKRNWCFGYKDLEELKCFFERILDEGIPSTDPDPWFMFMLDETTGLSLFTAIIPLMLMRGHVTIDASLERKRHFLKMVLTMTDKKLFVDVEDEYITVRHRP